MKIGIILSNADPEVVWIALRFANTAILDEHEVKVFLLGKAVEIDRVFVCYLLKMFFIFLRIQN